MNRLIILGDSTAAQKPESARPETGWGEVFGKYLKPGWLLDNRAINGRSTKDVIARGEFAEAFTAAASGDIVLIQYGHNDEKLEDPFRGARAWHEYTVNLMYMAEKLKAKGARVIFITSIARRCFDNGLLQDTHGDYAAAAKAAAHQAGVPCVDATLPAMLEYQRMGEDSRRFHMDFAPGIYPNYPDGDADGTHLRPEGAAYYASLIMRLVREEDAGAPFLR